MKRFAVLLAVTIVLAACSSTSSKPTGARAKIQDPEMSIEQLHGPAQENYAAGNIEIQYEIGIANRSDIPMTLKRIAIHTVNPAGGAYSLVPRSYYFNKTIPPHGEESVQFWAKGYFYGRGPRESEPVSVQGTAYFDTPSGYYDKVFVADIAQY